MLAVVSLWLGCGRTFGIVQNSGHQVICRNFLDGAVVGVSWSSLPVVN